AALRALHSLPTRRSSDLARAHHDLARVVLVRQARDFLRGIADRRGLFEGEAGAFQNAARLARGVFGAAGVVLAGGLAAELARRRDRKSTRLNSSHVKISY